MLPTAAAAIDVAARAVAQCRLRTFARGSSMPEFIGAATDPLPGR